MQGYDHHQHAHKISLLIDLEIIIQCFEMGQQAIGMASCVVAHELVADHG